MIIDYKGFVFCYAFTDLQNTKLWTDAIRQVFSSLITLGALTTFASYNDFRTNCHQQAIIVGLVDCFTSLIAGMWVWTSVPERIQQRSSWSLFEVPGDSNEYGPQIAFISYLEVILRLPGPPQLSSFLFFTILFTLGIDSSFGYVEVFTTALIDHYRFLGQKRIKPFVVMGTCTIGFLLGLTMCTKGGIYIFDFLRKHIVSWNVLIFGLLELFVIVVLYGPNKFMANIQEMGMLEDNRGLSQASRRLLRATQWYWKTCWCVIIPIALLTILIHDARMASVDKNHKYDDCGFKGKKCNPTS